MFVCTEADREEQMLKRQSHTGDGRDLRQDLPFQAKAASRQAIFIREVNTPTMDTIPYIGTDDQKVPLLGRRDDMEIQQ